MCDDLSTTILARDESFIAGTNARATITAQGWRF